MSASSSSNSQLKSKIKPKEDYKNIQINNTHYYYKDTLEPAKSIHRYQFNCFRKCGAYLHIPIHFDFPKYFSKESTDVPQVKVYSADNKRDNTISKSMNEHEIYQFGSHQPECEIVSENLVI